MGPQLAAAVTSSSHPSARPPARLWWLAGLCAVVPDVDIVGFRWGIPYSHMLGQAVGLAGIVFRRKR